MTETITITRDEYEALIDARNHAVSMAAIRAGADTLTGEALDRFLAAPSPLAFWREHRGLTQTLLAARVGIDQDQLARLEEGEPAGDIKLFADLARELRLSIEDLLE